MTTNSDNKIISIPINLRLRQLGVNKFTITKKYFSMDCRGVSVFIEEYADYADIYERTEYQLLNDNDYVSAEFIGEMTVFLEENCNLIKNTIKSLRGDGL